jgi:DNA-binding IclR family transcriptional regulator
VHARASGKLLLAFAPAAERDRLLSETQLRPLTSRTITDPSKLDKELEKIRAERIAFDLCEFHDNVVCVSVPITEASVVVGCYTVSIPSERWTADRQHIINEVRCAAEKASNLCTRE